MSLAIVPPSTAIETFDPGRAGSVARQLAAFAEAGGHAAAIAETIYRTEFVPEAIRGNKPAVTACILKAAELEISPLHGVAQIHIIKGRPGLAAELMRALVERAGHEIWFEDITDTRVVMCGRRAGQENTTKVTWTEDMAKRAGLMGNQSWRSYPQAMLVARATSQLCRLRFADVLAGMSYAVEELEDLDAETAAGDETPPPRRAGTTRRAAPSRRRAAATPQPSLEAGDVGPPQPPLPGEDDPPPAADGMPIDQQIAMRAREAGVDHHEVVDAVTFGEKSSAKELTGQEAADVLAAIAAIADGTAQLAIGEKSWVIERVEVSGDGGEVEPTEEVPFTKEEWTAYLGAKGVTVAAALRWAQTRAAEIDATRPTSVGSLSGHAVAGDLFTAIEGGDL